MTPGCYTVRTEDCDPYSSLVVVFLFEEGGTPHTRATLYPLFVLWILLICPTITVYVTSFSLRSP